MPLLRNTPDVGRGKRFQRSLRGLLPPAALGALLIALALLAGLAPGAARVARAQDAPTPAPTFDPTRANVPTAPPSARVGQSLYFENCAPCHGETGNADGPTVAELPGPPTAFSDPTALWELAPANLFHTAKFGRLEAMMPPWLQRMDDNQIWNSIWYAWSLHTSQDEVATGQTLYAESCAGCHGETGAGDGPDAAALEGGVADLADQSRFVLVSNEQWLQGWLASHPEVGGDWSVSEQTAAIEYMRTFGYTAPWESAWQPGDGAIRGAVSAGTADGPAVEGLVASVDAYLEFDRVATFTTTVGADGSFAFIGLSTDPTLNYIASVLSEGISYSSDFISLTPETPVADTAITVYGTTQDATVLTVDRLHWIMASEPGALQVVQIFAVGNSSERTYVGNDSEGAPEPVTFAMQLPGNAQNIQFDNGVMGDRFHEVGPVIYDTLPVLPGEGTRQVVVRYVVPFEGNQATLEQEQLYPVGEMSLLVADFADLKVAVDGLTFQSIQAMGEQDYQFWEGANVEQRIVVDLDGLPATGDPSPFGATTAAAAGSTAVTTGSASESTVEGMAATTTPPPELWMAVLVAAVVMAGLIGVLLWANQTGALRKGYSRADLNSLSEQLLDRIARLDDLHAIGDLSDSEWMKQRAQLKVQLVDVMARMKSGGRPA